MRFDLIAFDADDTLWHEERKYSNVEERFIELLTPYHSPGWIREQLHKRDVANLAVFGYGVKGFVLSMIETAVDLTEGRISGREIEQIIKYGRAMLAEPIECFPHVIPTLELLTKTHRLMLITKGDLFDQESKVARSGLGDYFDQIRVVSDKRPATYRRILQRNGVEPSRFMMVGNALRSDILPVVSVGGIAVYIPGAFSWAHEQVSGNHDGFATLEHLGQLPAYIEQLEGRPLSLINN